METEDQVVSWEEYYATHPAITPLPGVSFFETLAYDLLQKIFYYLGTNELTHGYKNQYRTCKRWFRVLGNINELIKIWPITPDFNGYNRTSQFLRLTKFIPSPETVSKLNWKYTEGHGSKLVIHDNLFPLFRECYSPDLWKHLPMPTWKHVKNWENPLEGITALKLSLSGILSRGHYAFSYILNLIKKNNPSSLRGLKFNGDILQYLSWCYQSAGRYEEKTLKFMDWFVQQSFCTITPWGLERLVGAKVPLEHIKKYAELKIEYDWDSYEHELKPLKGGKAEIYYEIFRGYHWRLSITEQHEGSIYHNPAPLPRNSDTVQGFLYFYRKCPLEKIRGVLQMFQNALTSREYNVHIRDFLYYIEDLLRSCSDVHPLYELYSWDWHQTKGPFQKQNRQEEDKKARIEWEKNKHLYRDKKDDEEDDGYDSVWPY